MRRILPAVILVFSTTHLTAQSCTVQQSTVSTAQQQVQRDEEAIRAVNPGLQTVSLQDWAKAAKNEKHDILVESLKDGALTLISGGVDKATEELQTYALQPMDIAGYHLPNGIGSLGTGQANAIIRNLAQEGVTTDTFAGNVLISAIRQAGRSPSKKAAIDILRRGVNAVADAGADQALHSSKPAGSLDEQAVSAAGLAFQLAADLAGQGDLAVGIANALFKGGHNEFDALVISKSIDSLGSSVEQQLRAINALNAPLKNHVARLQQAQSALKSCQSLQATTPPTPSNSKASIETAQSATDHYNSQRKALMDHAKADTDAMDRCLTAQIACTSGCSDPGWASCMGSCNARGDACSNPLQKDWTNTTNQIYILDGKHYGFVPTLMTVPQ